MGLKAVETRWGWVSKFLTQFCPVSPGTRDPWKTGSGPCRGQLRLEAYIQVFHHILPPRAALPSSYAEPRPPSRHYTNMRRIRTVGSTVRNAAQCKREPVARPMGNIRAPCRMLGRNSLISLTVHAPSPRGIFHVRDKGHKGPQGQYSILRRSCDRSDVISDQGLS